MALKILLAAGGTGGHLIPAIAFGQWLRGHGEKVLWLTGCRPLEKEICEAHHIIPQTLPLEGSPLGIKGLRALKRWGQLLTSILICRRILKKERIDGCVLFGGYLSLPVLVAAKSLGIPLVLHEQNTLAGKITRLAFRWNVPIATAWQECSGIPKEKCLWAGMPLRQFRVLNKTEAQRELLGTPLRDKEKLAVILGGSLGSEGLAKSLQSLFPVVESNGWRLLFMGISPEHLPFPRAVAHEPCWDMSAVYAAADLILCRAGAATLAELEFFSVPAVVVPWRDSAGGHQERNARYFAQRGHARLWTEDSSLEELLEVFSSDVPPKGDAKDSSSSSERLWAVLQRTVVTLKGEKRLGSQRSGS